MRAVTQPGRRRRGARAALWGRSSRKAGSGHTAYLRHPESTIYFCWGGSGGVLRLARARQLQRGGAERGVTCLLLLRLVSTATPLVCGRARACRRLEVAERLLAAQVFLTASFALADKNAESKKRLGRRSVRSFEPSAITCTGALAPRS